MGHNGMFNSLIWQKKLCVVIMYVCRFIIRLSQKF